MQRMWKRILAAVLTVLTAVLFAPPLTLAAPPQEPERLAATSLLTDECSTSSLPAATLLFPYVEVQLDQPDGRTTLLGITNETVASALARVVIVDPYHFPLSVEQVTARLESGGGLTTLTPSPPIYFPLGRVTQRVPVEVLGTLPGPFGVIELDLDLPAIPIANGEERANQAWVVTVLKASGRFSVGLNAHPVSTACPVKP